MKKNLAVSDATKTVNCEFMKRALIDLIICSRRQAAINLENELGF